MADALTTGNQFLQDVLAKLPEEHRAAAAAAFAASQDAVQALGAGALRLQDYSRNMDAVRADQTRAQELYEQNRRWYEQNQADLQSLPQLIEENARLKTAAPGTPAPGTPAPAAPPKTTADTVSTSTLQEVISESLGLHVVIPSLVTQHFHRFGEWLSEEQLAGLVANAQQGQRTIKAQYALTFGEKLAAKSEADRAAEIARIKAEGVAEHLRAHPNLPYPVRQTGSSPLDVFKSGPIDPASVTPEALAAEYNALVAAKGATA